VHSVPLWLFFMKIISKNGDPNIAEVFVAQFRNDPQLLAELVDAKDPNLPRSDKWVIIVSTQFGCPVECLMCDSGGDYRGNLSAEEILAQIDYVVSLHPSGLANHCNKFKIQFARMGEPALNPAVPEVLRELPHRYDNPRLIPCLATTAPAMSSDWFEKLLKIKQTIYQGRTFQLQFSINATNETERDRLMPIPKLTMKEIAEYGNRFVQNGDRKIGLNFALTDGVSLDSDIIAQRFRPDKFCIKVTPLNPTDAVTSSGLKSALYSEASDASGIRGYKGHFLNWCPTPDAERFISDLQKFGFDVIISIGEPKENEIGSNCGQAIRKLRALPHSKALR